MTNDKATRLPRSTLWLIVMLLAVLLVGFAPCGGRRETGSEELAMSLHTLASATVGKVYDLRTPAESYPDQQLEFWEAEIDRILKLHPGDAELHAAAAVVLSQPCSLYLPELIQKARTQGHGWDYPSIYLQTLNSARILFDHEGWLHATLLLRKATELQPDDPRWWRLRAVLLWPSWSFTDQVEPLDPNWQTVLQDARRHDPDNALYDLLEAKQISDLAIRWDTGFSLRDVDAWSRTIELCKQAAACDHLTFGEPALPGIVRLHRLSRHPTASSLESIRARFIGTRVPSTVLTLIRGLLRMAEVNNQSVSDQERYSIALLAQQIGVLARERSGSVCRFDVGLARLDAWAWDTLEQLEGKTSNVSEATILGLEQAAGRSAALTTAATRFNRQNEPTRHARVGLLSATVLPMFAAFLGFCLVLSFAWCALVRSSSSLQLSMWPAVILILAVSTSMFFLGVGGAGVVSETMQHWVFTGLTFITAIVLLGGAAVRSKLRFRYRIRSLLISSAVVAAILQLAFHLQIGWSSLGLPMAVHAQAEPLTDLIVRQHAQKVEQLLPGPAWVSKAALHWLGHHGPFWSVVIFAGWALIALVWRKNFRDSIGQFLIASAVFALVCINLWVWIEPNNYVAARPKQMSYEAYIRSIDEYYEPIAKLYKEAEIAASSP